MWVKSLEFTLSVVTRDHHSQAQHDMLQGSMGPFESTKSSQSMLPWDVWATHRRSTTAEMQPNRFGGDCWHPKPPEARGVVPRPFSLSSEVIYHISESTLLSFTETDIVEPHTQARSTL